MPISPLEPLITYQEIADATEHFGETKNVGELFRCLTGLGAFQYPTAKAVATRCIYAPHKDFNEQKREWGDHRFERLRQGNASVTKREAEFLHQAFAFAFSTDWAERTSLKSLIQTPIGELIKQLQTEAPLDNADAVQLASILTEIGGDDAPMLKIELDADRFTRKNGASEAKAMSELAMLKPHDRYFLWADNSPGEGHFLVIEFAGEPLLIDGKEIRAQTMTEAVLFEDKAPNLEGIEPLVVDGVPGRFHYLSLVSQTPLPSLPEMIAEEELQTFLKEIVASQMRGCEISASMLSYRVNG